MKPRVLIVDDEEAIRFFAMESLTAAGWDVYEVDSGEMALQVLAQTSCNIVFLDLRMEGMDGLETMRGIKNRWPDTNIILMTAYATLEPAI
jgi:DNA-binding response OmpR family regulator